jgi:protein SCO1/2
MTRRHATLRMRTAIRLCGSVLLALLAATPSLGDTPGAAGAAGSAASVAAGSLPKALEGVRFDQRLGEHLPLDLVLRDERGNQVRLGEFFDERPVVLSLGYYGCPMLCPLVMDGIVRSLKPLTFSAGQEFDVVTVSIDPDEGADDASRRREQSLDRYDRAGSDAGWHFLTASPESIARLTDAVGFRYSRDPATREYAHAAGVVVATPRGEIARYLFGAEFSPRDLRLALVEASENRIGALSDQLLLFCFHYDPAAGRYSAVALGSLRAAGVLTVVALAGLIGLALWREKRIAARTAKGVA